MEVSVISGTSPDRYIHVRAGVFQVGLYSGDALVRIVQCCFYDPTRNLWPNIA